MCTIGDIYKLERVSLANVKAKINKDMLYEDQLKIMKEFFHYSPAGASMYLIRNNLRGINREEWVNRNISKELTKNAQAMIYADKFNTKIAAGLMFLNKINYPSGKLKELPKPKPEPLPVQIDVKVEEIEEAKTLAKPEEPKPSSDNLFDDIQKTMLEIKQMESTLAEKKQWLRMLMEEYIS